MLYTKLPKLFQNLEDPVTNYVIILSPLKVRTIRKVIKGEQIFDNYGVVYAVNDYDERQSKLVDQYFFRCNCICCEEKWPLYEGIPKELNQAGVKCEDCLKKAVAAKGCGKCANELDNVRMVQYQAQEALGNFLFIKQKLLLTNADTMKRVDGLFESWYNYLGLLEKHKVKRPFVDYNNYQEALKQLLNLIYMK